MLTPNSAPDPNKSQHAGFETRDMEPKKIVPFVFFSAVFLFVSAISAYAFYNLIVKSPDTNYVKTYPKTIVRVIPAQPVLQANPREDLHQLLAKEYAEADSYSVNPTTHHLRIPIRRAMDLVAEEGLPTRSNPATPDSNSPNEPADTSGQATASQNQNGFGGGTSSSYSQVPVTSSQQVPSEGEVQRSPYANDTGSGDNTRY